MKIPTIAKCSFIFFGITSLMSLRFNRTNVDVIRNAVANDKFRPFCDSLKKATIFINGNVTDELGMPLQGVKIIFLDVDFVVFSDSNGSFNVSYNSEVGRSTNLKVTHKGFVEQVVSYSWELTKPSDLPENNSDVILDVSIQMEKTRKRKNKLDNKR